MKIKPEHYRVLVKVFEYYGCIYIRTNGDHMVFHCPEAVRPVVTQNMMKFLFLL